MGECAEARRACEAANAQFLACCRTAADAEVPEISVAAAVQVVAESKKASSGLTREPVDSAAPDGR
jgi:hypothetical protein